MKIKIVCAIEGEQQKCSAHLRGGAVTRFTTANFSPPPPLQSQPLLLMTPKADIRKYQVNIYIPEKETKQNVHLPDRPMYVCIKELIVSKYVYSVENVPVY